uniref:Uncharacterized protein n=1 Tax=Daucus carota subsp. sativus TaxID=79200 RepID=A0A164Z4N0_DAUCS
MNSVYAGIEPVVGFCMFLVYNSKLLKQSLLETLTRFYPFAGKVRDDFYIDCNDEGVHYIVTRVNVSLLDFLGQSPGDEMIRRLIPATYAVFLKDWTAAVRRSSSEIVHPSFTGPSLFPQIPSLLDKCPIDFSKINFPSQRFVFSGPKLAALKAQTEVLISECVPSRFEVVAALLWKCVAKAASKSYESSLGKPFNLGMIINLRGKNCVPKNSVGNLVWRGLAQCKLSPQLEPKTLVHQIKKCKTEINDDFVEAMKE